MINVKKLYAVFRVLPNGVKKSVRKSHYIVKNSVRYLFGDFSLTGGLRDEERKYTNMGK